MSCALSALYAAFINVNKNTLVTPSAPPPARQLPRWTLAAPDDATREAARALAHALNLPAPLALVLAQRGHRDAKAATDFLFPKLGLLGDPFALPGMAAAIARLGLALERGEKIVLYGDYDVDGVTSLTLFARLLAAYGARVACFLPARIEEGYGLSAEGVARCVAEHAPQLLVAVDCGTTSTREIARLQANGVDVLIFDHHEPGAHDLPPCVALVNPKLGADYHYLCSAGLVFKACHALLKARPLPAFDLKDFLDLAALGTVADIVPLVGENRVLVRRGLRTLAASRWPGVRALVAVAGVRPPFKPADIGFRLAPRLNAAGRLGTAQAALELLLTDDADRARELAEALNAQNRERQEVEQRTVLEAEAMLAALENFPHAHAAIVLGQRGWHPGVIGIVAGRLVRAHHRPALVIGFDENGVGKGSGRSIEGLSLVAALNACAHLLDRHGGHEMAAGLSIREAAFAEFAQLFHATARGLLTDEQLQPRLRLDAELSLDELDADFLSAHELLQPFGMGNARPLFLARGVVPLSPPRVLKEKHLKFQLRQAGFASSRTSEQARWRPAIPAIFFNAAADALPPAPWDVAFQIEPNEFRGETTLQVQIQALRTTE